MTTLSPDKKAVLAQRLRRRTKVRAIDPREPGTEPPPTPAQERLWFLEQYRPGTAAYTIPLVVRVRGHLDGPTLEAALAGVADRHESLRMRFPTDDDGRPGVVIDPQPRVELVVTEAVDEAGAHAIGAELLARTFDLAGGPLWRAALITIAPGDHLLVLAVHHIVADGWSADVILREVLTLCGGGALEEPGAQYGDYALWERARDHGGELGYWRDRLDGLPALDLPTDLSRPAEQSSAGAGHEFRIDADLAARVRGLAAERGATPYMVLLAALHVLLARHSGQTDFAVGSPVAGRDVPELDAAVGMFVNTLVLRADLAGDPGFGELLDRTRETALDAYAHQTLPFDRLVTELNVARDVSRTPLFQVMFALQNYGAGAALAVPGYEVAGLTLPPAASRFDLSFYLHETPDGMTGYIVYNSDLFLPGTVERMAERYARLLHSATDAPDTRVSRLGLLTERESAALAAFTVSPEPPPTASGTLQELVAAQAAATPGATAIVCGTERLTYAELDRRSGRLAALLRAEGVGPDVRVGVCLDQSADLAVAVLGVLRAGGAYIPLDPAQPAERLAYMIGDGQARTVITVAEHTDRLTGPTILLDGDPLAEGEPLPLIAGSPDDLAYVIYTSGTTGRPKGVGVQHRQVVNYLEGVRRRLDVPFGADYTLAQSLSFDFGVTIFYLSLLTGGTLHLVSPRTPAAELSERFRRTDYLKITPSHLASLQAEAPGADLLPRRTLVLGGEASRAGWAGGLTASCQVVNHYGPTEATVGITTYAVSEGTQDAAGMLPIGRPLPGARVYVLDEHLSPAPIGVPGEVYLGGDRLARGYLGRPGLTAERFLPDPYGEPGARMYRTGDIGRWSPEGDLHFLGRRDLQVKVRGYRVELPEIEAVLEAVDGIDQAVVEARGDRLVAYLVGARISVSELRGGLADRLPDYMIPARYVWLDELPLKSHGKVDRAALPEPDDDRPDQEAGFAAPETPLEEAVAAIWAGVLSLSAVGVMDDFFDLGGHSLLAAQLVARLRHAVPPGGRQPTILDVFKHPNVRELARVMEAGATGSSDRLLHRLTPAGRRTAASAVCVPYGGGSAVIYQPLADALPEDWALYSVSVPGNELGEEARPSDEVAERCVAEIMATVEGPLVLYGHCGLGVTLTVEITRRLEAAGRTVEAVYLGGIFPFSRPSSWFGRMITRMERLRSDRFWANALRASGLDVDELAPEQLRMIIENRRQSTEEAERYFTRLFEEGIPPLRAPVVSVAGERDPAMEFYQERYPEWHLVASTVGLVVLDEANHFFLKYRSAELAQILTTVHPSLTTDDRPATPTWWVEGVSTSAETRSPAVPADEAVGVRLPAWQGTVASPASPPVDPPRVAARPGPQPSMRRFSLVALGQLASILGAALTEFAVPIWILQTTGSLVGYALFAVIALLPGLLIAPLAGAIVDRYDRRRVLLAANVAAGGVQLGLGALLWTGNLRIWQIYPLLAVLSLALAFQRLAYQSAIPQLVPKRFLGHANGIVQTATGTAQLMVPLVAAAMMAVIGLEGILVLDVVGYSLAIAVLLLTPFPATMAARRRETVMAEMVGGFRYSWGHRGFRGMLAFFALFNLLLSPLFLLLTPLVLAFATLQDVGRVSFAGGLGALLGGLTVAVWGGPRRMRMRGMLLAGLALAVFCLATGVVDSLIVIAVGAFGMSYWLAVLNGVYATLLQVKVPQRFHGRVMAINQMIAWSTLPVGFGLVAPYGTALFEPLLAPGGPLADTVGAVIGTGPGRGIGLMYLVLGLGIAVLVLIALRVRALSRFDTHVPDALPDDLVGLAVLEGRAHGLTSAEEQKRVSVP
ncbi:non-ribosomal peptide synthetase/MFS transporter [Spongiactinospora sp. TRM90649]|uniref:non-ribosomal peptide synthetase/MFS transporter n=1 Tax=Spongiactinospora sp. TRM90649 TaxID=3031114 RepID=UPI0023FA3F0E|nr:non-ribosomal peptide synthetase/MFS transporter [Spongiactinospora sp. TRM90649]MDF5754047.1 amino acid adenylation domain-containing protein [Spongiactinospora sp. TRM90649]